MTTRGVAILAGGIPETIETARAAEAGGYDAAWTAEFLDRSAIVALAAMAQSTSRIRVCSGIAYGVGRSPLILANEARGLDELSDGRLVLGLGTGTKGMQIGWHGVSDPEGPATRMEELIPLLRRLWKLHEGPVKHEGRFYSCNITPTADVREPRREAIPVYTAGVNRRMVETAGRVSDGLLCHPTFSKRYIDDVVRPAVARGKEKTGREDAPVEIVGVLITSVHDDEAQARREVAGQIAFYCAPKAYGPMLEASGFAREGEAIREKFAAKEFDAMIDAVSDDMIDAMAVAGSADQVRAGVQRRSADFDHVSLYSPSFKMSPERIVENMRSFIAACAPG